VWSEKPAPVVNYSLFSSTAVIVASAARERIVAVHTGTRSWSLGKSNPAGLARLDRG
jgi:hypothetical protein